MRSSAEPLAPAPPPPAPARPAPRRLTCVIPALVAGGAERVLSVLANHWAAEGWPVTIVTFDDGRAAPFYGLHPGVAHAPIDVLGRSRGVAHAVLANVGRARRLRAALRSSRPDVVLSFLDSVNVLTLLASRGLRVPVVVAERSDPGHYPLGRGWALLRSLCYPRADVVVTQSRQALLNLGAAARDNGRVIPNPVLPPAPASRDSDDGDAEERVVLALGRLVPEKGYDLLVEAFAAIASRNPAWHLRIVGEGPARPALETRVRALDLGGRVSLPGVTHEPGAALRAADLFVMSSRVEGFPNALAEAMACGLPVVSFDCPSGPRELVRHDVDGLLVPAGDVPALAATLERLMRDAGLRSRLAGRAPEVVERFALARIAAEWERAFEAAARRAAGAR